MHIFTCWSRVSSSWFVVESGNKQRSMFKKLILNVWLVLIHPILLFTIYENKILKALVMVKQNFTAVLKVRYIDCLFSNYCFNWLIGRSSGLLFT